MRPKEEVHDMDSDDDGDDGVEEGRKFVCEDPNEEGGPNEVVEVPVESDVKETGKVPTKRGPPDKVEHQHHHFTRSKAKCKAFEVLERPPKPAIPKKRIAMEQVPWQKAMRRELQKIMAEDTIHELPRDNQGEYILPDDAVVMNLFEILEYKWKVDPETGEERWLECIRAVVDGSMDKRTNEIVFAETPDRTVLLLMMSIGATIGEEAMISDAVRAYLNAEAIDRNLVVVASKYMGGIPKKGLLNKGLYGILKGALGWEKWAEKKIVGNLKFNKCLVARSMYHKRICGQVVRLYRHTDDFRMSCKHMEVLMSQATDLSNEIRMGEWKKCDRFLGFTVEYVQPNGVFSRGGNICLIRAVEKISEMERDFSYLREVYNPKSKSRFSPTPGVVIKKDEELENGMGIYLDDMEKGKYMSLVGKIGYIATSLRFDARYAYLILSRRISNPRRWEMYLAVWVMDYLGKTRDLPLVLGGNSCELQVYCDASFATLEERKSVKSACVRTSDGSGIIWGTSGVIKNIVQSTWEAEVNAAADAVDMMIYLVNICEELSYAVGSKVVRIDNESAINWLMGENISSKTKHVELRLFRLRHIVQQALFDLEYVTSEQNISDILTKPMVGKKFIKLRALVMGHTLVKDYEVTGVEKEQISL